VLFERAVEFFSRVAQSPEPEADAEILLALFHSLEYRALLMGEPDDLTRFSSTIRRYVSLLLPNLLAQVR